MACGREGSSGLILPLKTNLRTGQNAYPKVSGTGRQHPDKPKWHPGEQGTPPFAWGHCPMSSTRAEGGTLTGEGGKAQSLRKGGAMHREMSPSPATGKPPPASVAAANALQEPIWKERPGLSLDAGCKCPETCLPGFLLGLLSVWVVIWLQLHRPWIMCSRACFSKTYCQSWHFQECVRYVIAEMSVLHEDRKC